MERFQSAAHVLGSRIQLFIEAIPDRMKKQVQEIRLRIHAPVALVGTQAVFFLNTHSPPSIHPGEDTLRTTAEDIQETFSRLCEYSVYAHQNEISRGYLTYRGGHRAGLCGTAVREGERLVALRDISSINLRVSRQIYGAASGLVEALGSRLREGLLLAGPPACGKTTLLRDLCRQLSQGVLGQRRTVAIVDERGELAAVYAGEPQNDLGPCCDVLDGYPKGEGILQAVRSLSPTVVVCDELGGQEELEAVLQSVNAGVGMIASIHAGSPAQLVQRKQARALLESGAFPWVAMMENTGAFGAVTGIFKAGDLLVQAGGHSAPSPHLVCGGVSGGV